MAIVLMAVIGGGAYYYTTPSGKEVFHRLLLSVPIFGELTKKIQVSEFSRLLSMLLRSGVQIIEALNIVANAMPNVHFKKAFKEAAKEVEKGIPLAVPISKNDDFPMIVSRIVATGENTGNLDKVLEDIHKFYQAEVDSMTSNLTKLMEPIILIVVGGMVAVIALVVYMPIYGIADVIT
jgi:type IV pilus assembly protein PilC